MITINDKQYDFQEGLTVSGALRLAFGRPRNEYIVSVNGEMLLRSLWDETCLEDGAELVFTEIASGG